MGIKLIVTSEFEDYAQGSEITDADVIADVLASERAQFVVKVNAPDAPPVAPEAPPVAKAKTVTATEAPSNT